ncbi:DUF5979 domain-containing protein [Actinomyces naeslundii]|uniref:DUF5979 domain-containing protein n=1 Tax=Actinomyces naeslundii TaxID=1655 RepID=UPI00094DB4BE|nr:DUF5979 domain-containing protein [Actinomyces naeslundii]OLO83309.1 hypothetical protein BKH11_11775 [Actinomyces naeslundii]OMG13422.1 hypothetical protein BKH08_03470 [Actinomyces naeslundii]
MQVPADLRRTASRGQPTAAWLALLTLLASMIVPLQAQATVNADINLSGLALVKSDRSGNDFPSEGLTTQDVAKLSYTWDATNTTVNPGDSFSIDLGANFKNLENPKTVPLNLPYNGTPTEVGACKLTEKIMECTFSEKVEELKAAGFKDFKGSGQALLLITQATTAQSVDMTVNSSQKVSVRLPGAGGIKGPAARNYTALKFSKVSSVITSASSTMTWEVNFGSDYIKEQLAKGDSPIASDGQTRETITITDTLGSGMAFSGDKNKWYLGLRNSAAEPGISGVSLTSAAGKDLSSKYGDFDLDVDIQGQVATIKVTGPFAPESNYRISYPVTFTSQNGKAIAGAQYTNAASLDHSEAHGEFTRSYADSFKVTVDMAPGFGGFEVSKTLGGAALDAVDVANTTLPVKVDYVLPGPASGYTGWQAPGTLNADGLSGTAVLNISIGKTNTFQGTFPKGTVVTLSEDTGQASPAPSGYAWGKPVFAVGRTETNTLTIGDRVSTKVTLNNTADVAKAPGTFQVTKTVAGAQAGDKEFTFTYTCTDGTEGTLKAKANGEAVSGPKVPTGTQCTVTEDAKTAAIDGYTLTAPEAQTVTIKDPAEPVATAAFTNSYVRDTGSFSVTKSVKGDYTPQAGETVKVGYTCNDPDSTKGTLDVPMDGTAVGGPTLPTGTACTLNEDNTSAQREGYALATTYSTTTATIAKDQVPNVSVTNTYTRQTGGFSVSKTVQGDGAKLAPAEFTFEYTCTDKVTGKAASPKQLVVKTGQTAHVNDLPTGSCTLTEKDASAKATSLSTTLTVNGTPAQEDKATFDVLGGDNPAVNISATNTYTLDRSTFQVTKTVTGAQAGDKEFAFAYTCTDGTEGALKAKANGEAVSGPKVPTGTQCTVTEDAKTAAIDGYTLTAPEAQTVTAPEKDQVVNTPFTNTYTRDTGTFSIAKSIQGGPEGAANGSYSFTYTCDGGVQGTLAVPGDGTAVSSPKIPTGVSCTLAEDAVSAAKDGYSVASALTQDSVTITKDQTVAVTATNTYTRDTGTFSVTKSVKGGYAPQAGENVKVGYTCNDPEGTKGTLDVPMDGTAVGGPTLPTGTVCTLSEDNASAQREGYAVSTAYSATTATIAKDKVAEVSVTNTYTRQTGGFSVSKTVEGDGAKLAPSEFTFEYTCTDQVTGKATSPKQLVVKTGQTAHVDDLPTGSCTLTEKDAPVKATSLSTTLAVDGTPAQEGKATFDVLGGDNPAINISATNTYTLDRSTFQVTKKVEGDGAETHKNVTFTFEYSCTSDVEGEVKGELTARGDGTAVSGPALPVGATCSVSEKTSSAQVNGYDVKTPETQSVTIAEKDAALSFTNTYTRQTGTFTVSKAVAGAQAGDKEFTFTYTCTDGTEGTLKAKADGKAVSGPKVPTGTQCTVTEDAKTAAIDGYTLAAPEAQTVTVSEKDQVVNTSFTNTYTTVADTPSPSATPKPSASSKATPSESASSDPTPSGSASSAPTPSGSAPSESTPSNPTPSGSAPNDPAQDGSGSPLARTGAYVGIPLALALAAIAGGVLLAYRRRA